MEIRRRSLFESSALQIGLFEARPSSDACGEVERQSLNAIVLPFSGLFAKQEAPGRPTADRPDLARERFARGESVPLFRSYADPGILTDDLIRLYLQPPLSSRERIDAFQRYWLGFDNRHTIAIHEALKQLQVPTLIVWGLKDIFFNVKWAYWLKDTIPGAKRVIEVEDARLFFPEDRPDTLAPPILQFWDELGR